MEDALGFAAFGGLERLAIIAGALLVGYWGYRLYVDGKAVGLAFLGIACVVLFGALLTGGSHLRTMGESIQLASSSTGAADRLAQIERAAIESAAEVPGSAPIDGAAADPGVADITPAPASGNSTGSIDAAGPQKAAAPPQLATDSPPLLAEPAPDRPDGIEASRDRLPTAQELGGRIVSVKSGNLSLEWSPTPADQ